MRSARYAVMLILLPILPVVLGADAMLEPVESISVSELAWRPPCLCAVDGLLGVLAAAWKLAAEIPEIAISQSHDLSRRQCR
jgi:hypothetical protein